MLVVLILPVFSGSAQQEWRPDTVWNYKQVDGKHLSMSVFLPENYREGDSFPVIVFFHGGSWKAGKPDWQYPDCAYWRNRGMIAVSVDYRLKDRDNVQVPLECVRDARASICFLKENAAKLKIDTGSLVVAGSSAGGQLAAALAMIPGENGSMDCAGSGTFRPDAVILYNPYFKCEAELSPPNFITSGLPPVIIFLGDQDRAVAVDEMKSFHQSLIKHRNYSLLYIAKGGKHGFCNGRNPQNPYFYWSLELADQFLVNQGILTGHSVIEVPDGVPAPDEINMDTYK